jgi:lipopolysaccharide/colanic/teichoic acid biosynthesis glycosyltransferase
MRIEQLRQDEHAGVALHEGRAAVGGGVASPVSIAAERRGRHAERGAVAAYREHAGPLLREPPRSYLVAKRGLDVCAAVLLLVLLAPLMAAVALAVRLTSPGPVLFRQERCGLRGEPFTVFKFRTMYIDAEARMAEVRALDVTDGPTFKSPVDPRVTPLGRFLRRSSLDEMPQLWHVLTGEMSLVGPRPLVTSETLQLPEWALERLAAKPGLTCTWQVSGRSLIPFEEWMQLDIEYVHARGFWLDLRLLARTPLVVLTGRGAF